MTDPRDTDEHEIEPRGTYHSRRLSSREIALGVGLLFNFGTLIWQLSAANQRFELMRTEMNELKQSNATLVATVGRNMLLEYRVAELERQLREKPPR